MADVEKAVEDIENAKAWDGRVSLIRKIPEEFGLALHTEVSAQPKLVTLARGLAVKVLQSAEVKGGIREFVTSTTGTGFSKKGLSLTTPQAEYLYSILPSIIRRMKDVTKVQQTPESNTG